MSERTAVDAEPSSITAIVEDVAHYLPQQAPLNAFVHHNTLHAFEDRPFDEAVVVAARLFGTRPYQTEQQFAQHLERGRILSDDLDAVLADEQRRQGGFDEVLVAGLRSRDYRSVRLRYLIEVPSGAALEWQLRETDLLSDFHPAVDASRRRTLEARATRCHVAVPARERVRVMLTDLWMRLEGAAPHRRVAAESDRPRRRDQLLTVGAGDTDQRVHPLLIRLSAAYLDQGVATWRMPGREHGFLSAVRRLYGQRVGPPSLWMRGLANELRAQQRDGLDAEATVLRALESLGVPPDRHREVILATLLSLRGWAGMMRQFEERPDRAPIEPRPARLIDFLAVQLTFDAVAARNALRSHLGSRAGWDELHATLAPATEVVDRELVYEAFVMAQVVHVDPEVFDEPGAAARWLAEVRAFDGIARRRMLHRAYERRLRVTTLDAIAAASRTPVPQPPAARFQAVFCIDERECSTRRHLEEAFPEVTTFGYAGFFGVAMAWRGLGEVRARPLCPVNITPTHFVTERALRPGEEQTWLAARRRRGLATSALLSSARTPARGGLVSTVLGLWSVIPMIGRCLFPRLSERLLRGFVDGNVREPVTRLVLERNGEERDADGRLIGYTHAEMADVVEAALRTIALTDDFCEVVLIVGHGSSSLNNPHESAHDCGATGGGRGGPNARAFAAMANHPRVRELLGERGIDVPDGTWFVGSYHNTCDDAMAYYDEDLMPDERAAALEAAKRALEVACALESHERCRRFESAPHSGDVAAALRHVEGRAVDLAQPRPEYGHATNAFAIVGRRERTRGLFLDRRAFLVSYDPTTDDARGSTLERLLDAVVPVGAGINLEYYFSFVDPVGYGCGTKLPHNITGLIGVMDGHASDLRTGLPWQMVEIHEPVRLLSVVEAEVDTLEGILHANPDMARFVANGWIQLIAWSPTSDRLHEFVDGRFEPYDPESRVLPVVASSPEFYTGEAGHLGCARVSAAFGSDVEPADCAARASVESTAVVGASR